ncbi:MAG TPA: GNAT family N-acetyltransferase [Dyella sp.]|uniref:GNAT family N-acetyltransferase n=1 Tax=Dyella sp. TaxID=1869338 RepID=UPI002F93F777
MTTSASQQSAKGAFDSFPHLLTGTHWIDRLQDDTPVLIRPLRPEDREREEDFIRRLSPKTRRYRFLGDFRQASPALIDQMMKIDFPRQVAFVALVHENGKLREIGVSRYAATTDDRQCECAVTVADDWQHRGLGVLLMRHLIDVARGNGFKHMFSIDDASNESMRQLAHFLGFRRELSPDDPARVTHVLDL